MESANKRIARAAYDGLCAALDRREWIYSKVPSKLAVTFKIKGDDIPMEFAYMVEEESMRLLVACRLPFKVRPNEGTAEMATAVCAASCRLMHGSFKLDFKNSEVTYILASTFGESKLGEGYFDYMIDISCLEVEMFNEKLFALAKGIVDITAFVKLLDEE